MTEKQYGGLVRSTHGLIENNAASTPVLYSPWLHDAKLQILIYFREKYKSHRANIFSFLSLHITPGNDPSAACYINIETFKWF